ncbi:hypothetical protein TWF225_001171 [Orbilia oligospora]|nr:hypothetical protein TWF225_001171 [Orbilia oligospora]KAF3234918.1 hypothetical protein TWF128_002166 [Orbilia oligospora]KAF3238149.1 hypothetical protein TWF217_001790 [Orbilia oligospora]KAF3276510.1 hypothetical protein TWF132_002165 [Orbilia oligospora]
MSVPLVLLIDALDECKDGTRGSGSGPGFDAMEERSEIEIVIDLLSKMKELRVGRGVMDVRVFLTIGPELSISHTFHIMSPGSYKRIELQYMDPKTIKNDTSTFLRREFENIPGARSNWPGDNAIRKLTQLANPLFIAAATICRFVKGTAHTPGSKEQRLKLILESGNTQGDLISELDRTYLAVLKRLEKQYY